MKGFLAVLLFLISTTTFVYAGTEKGTKEIQIQASYVQTDISTDEAQTYVHTKTGQLTFNYFFASWFSIGATGRISGNTTKVHPRGEDPLPDEETSNVFLLLRTDFYIGGPTKKIIPFIGATGGVTNYRSDSYSSTIPSYGAHAGLKIFPKESISVNLELDNTGYSPEDREGLKYDTIWVTGLFLGFSYYF